jgi:hypothetical protein
MPNPEILGPSTYSPLCPWKGLKSDMAEDPKRATFKLMRRNK